MLERAHSAATNSIGSFLASIDDDSTVGEMFNFQSNQLFVSCEF